VGGSTSEFKNKADCVNAGGKWRWWAQKCSMGK
jgi:hypothetical protein